MESKLGVSTVLLLCVLFFGWLVEDKIIEAPKNWEIIKYFVFTIFFVPVVFFLIKVSKKENEERKKSEE